MLTLCYTVTLKSGNPQITQLSRSSEDDFIGLIWPGHISAYITMHVINEQTYRAFSLNYMDLRTYQIVK